MSFLYSLPIEDDFSAAIVRLFYLFLWQNRQPGIITSKIITSEVVCSECPMPLVRHEQ
jgi:hypothetical protein